MALALQIVLERDVEGADPDSYEGKAVARAWEDIEGLARDLGGRGLGDFVSFSRSESETLAEDMSFDNPMPEGSTETWFPATEGLAVVRGVSEHLRENPEEVSDAPAVQKDLQALERLLAAAERANVGFRLSVDYWS